MKKLNRKLQRQILETLDGHYPAIVNLNENPLFKHQDFEPNFFYLKEHGLISASNNVPPTLSVLNNSVARLTMTGKDFLADDGGLTAIKKTVYVQLDAETIRMLLTSCMDNAQLDPSKKNLVMDKIKNMPAEIFNRVTLQMVQKTLENPSQVYTLLSQMLRCS